MGGQKLKIGRYYLPTSSTFPFQTESACDNFKSFALHGSFIWTSVHPTFEWFVQLLSFCFWILKATSLLSFISIFLYWSADVTYFWYNILSAIESMHWTKQAKKNLYFTFETNYNFPHSFLPMLCWLFQYSSIWF